MSCQLDSLYDHLWRKADTHKDRQLAGSADTGSSSEAFAIAEPDCDPVTKCIQEIVLELFIFVSNPKTLDLLNKVVPRFSLIHRRLIEGVIGVLNVSTIDISRHRNCALILAHCGEF